MAERVAPATHTVFLGEVHTARARSGSPLTYFRGTFGRFERSLDEAVYSELRERVLTRRLAGGGWLAVGDLGYELEVGAGPISASLGVLRVRAF